MNTSLRALLALMTVPIGILISTGCSDSPTDPVTPVNTANMDAFAADLPTWDEFSPQRQSANVQMGDPEEAPFTHDGRDFTCVTTNYSLTENPQEIVTFNPDSEILWLGSLLQGTGYVQGIGSLAELPIRQRAPLTISIDLLTQDNSRTVANPTVATVTQAIGDLISTAQATDSTRSG